MGIPSRQNRGVPKAKFSYKSYMKKLLSKIHPEQSLASPSNEVMDSLMTDLFEKITTQATFLMKCTGRKTLTERDIHFAVLLLLPGDLAKYAAERGKLALGAMKGEQVQLNVNGQHQHQRRQKRNSEESTTVSLDSDLLYETFRSNVRTHSSPVDIIGDLTSSTEELMLSI